MNKPKQSRNAGALALRAVALVVALTVVALVASASGPNAERASAAGRKCFQWKTTAYLRTPVLNIVRVQLIKKWCRTGSNRFTQDSKKCYVDKMAFPMLYDVQKPGYQTQHYRSTLRQTGCNVNVQLKPGSSIGPLELNHCNFTVYLRYRTNGEARSFWTDKPCPGYNYDLSATPR